MIGLIILVFGCMWVAEVFRRLPKDIAEYRAAKNFQDRAVQMFIWAVTVVFLAILFNWARLILGPAIHAIRAYH